MGDWPRRILKLLGKLRPGSDKKLAFGYGYDRTFQRLEDLRGLGLLPGNICDIGASDGKWTRKCLKVFPQAKYFCIDPLDENIPHLAKLGAKTKLHVCNYGHRKGHHQGTDVGNDYRESYCDCK